QALMVVEFSQLEGRFHTGLKLGQLLVHGNSFDGKTLVGVGFTHALEKRDCFFRLANAGVQVADGVEYGEVFGVGLYSLFVFGNGILQLPLLDVSFRGSKYLRSIEAKAKSHRVRAPSHTYADEGVV